MDTLKSRYDDFQEKRTIEKIIEEATSECLLKPNEERNAQICGYATRRGDLVLAVLRKRLEHSNPAVHYMALSVLEYCIQNANSTFHEDLSNDNEVRGVIVALATSQVAHPTVLRVRDLACRIALDLSRTFEHDEVLHNLADMHRQISHVTGGAAQSPPRPPPQPLPLTGGAMPQPQPANTTMECGFCGSHMTFPMNAKIVRCGGCGEANRVTRTVHCGSCGIPNEVLLTYSTFRCRCGSVNAVQNAGVTPPPQPTPNLPPWECPQCTFINPPSRQFQCAQCDFRRNVPTEPPPLMTQQQEPQVSPTQPWECRVCTFLCTRNKLTCEMCGAPKDPPPTETNHSGEQQQQQLPAVLPPPPPPPTVSPPLPPQQPQQTWICNTCTFENRGANNVCDMCSAHRGGQTTTTTTTHPVPQALPPPPQQSFVPWTCNVCTFQNTLPTSQRACEMCASARQ